MSFFDSLASRVLTGNEFVPCMFTIWAGVLQRPRQGGRSARTRIPAFLIHDSPREADLGQTIYDEHFRLLRALEEELAGGTFQYLITTTTRPPQDINQEPWRRAVLRGAPGRERLLGCDL